MREREKKKRRKGGKEERKRGKERRKGGEGKEKKERENMQIVQAAWGDFFSKSRGLSKTRASARVFGNPRAFFTAKDAPSEVSIWEDSMKCNDMARLTDEMQIFDYIPLTTYTHTCFENVVS